MTLKEFLRRACVYPQDAEEYEVDDEEIREKWGTQGGWLLHSRLTGDGPSLHLDLHRDGSFSLASWTNGKPVVQIQLEGEDFSVLLPYVVMFRLSGSIVKGDDDGRPTP